MSSKNLNRILLVLCVITVGLVCIGYIIPAAILIGLVVGLTFFEED